MSRTSSRPSLALESVHSAGERNDVGVAPEAKSVSDMRLDDSIKRELDLLRDVQHRFFQHHLRGNRNLQGIDWNAAQVAEICAALGTLFAQLLWDADRQGRAEAEVIVDAAGPRVRVMPRAGSRLERRQGGLHALELDAHEIATYIAPQCHLTVELALLVWSVIAPDLSAAEEAIPQVEIDSRNGVRVSLRSKTA